jgi:hypothetical protein
MDRVNEALKQFMRVEHHRLHCAEQPSRPKRSLTVMPRAT